MMDPKKCFWQFVEQTYVFNNIDTVVRLYKYMLLKRIDPA